MTDKTYTDIAIRLDAAEHKRLQDAMAKLRVFQAAKLVRQALKEFLDKVLK